jgi:hypothetical protein
LRRSPRTFSQAVAVRQLDGLPTISLAEPARRAAGEKAGVTFITEHGGDVRLRKDDK